jgi:hypothetical protein
MYRGIFPTSKGVGAMLAGTLKKLLEQVPDHAEVNVEVNQVVDSLLDKVDGEPIFWMSSDEKDKVDDHLWMEIAGITEVSWETCDTKYWHLNLGEVTGDG